MPKTERKLISSSEESPDSPYLLIPQPERFEENDTEFLRAKDIEAIATLLIDEYEDLAPLQSLRIGYAWKRSGGRSNHRQTLGKCVKSSGLMKYFSNTDIVIWLAADHLRELNRHPTPTPEASHLPATWWQIEAVTFHELQHISVDEEGAFTLKGHDFEGFVEEVKEYGPWKEDIEVMRMAFKQLPLGLV